MRTIYSSTFAPSFKDQAGKPDLGEELSDALESDFDFMGKHYFARAYPDYEMFEYKYGEWNYGWEVTIDFGPGTDVDGSTKSYVLDFPLYEYKVLCALERAFRSHFGRGDKKVVDTKVRDTWEIDGSKVKLNDRFLEWIEYKVLTDVWKGLGVATPSTKPRCELYKLLIYKPGGHFHAHQDTQKAEGMFATVIVLLPSKYEGGEVIITHSGKTDIIDFPHDSQKGMAIMAWYTDVLHEIKPITSGYRVALSFNLIHTSPNVPTPTLKVPTQLTEDDKTAKLQAVLEKWARDGFPKKEIFHAGKGYHRSAANPPPFFAYILQHTYSQRDLAGGMSCLKGQDAHKIALLLSLANELGFKLAFANLDIKVRGLADDYERYQVYWGKIRQEKERERKRRREAGEEVNSDKEVPEDDEDGEEKRWHGPVSFYSLLETDYILSNVVDQDGKTFFVEDGKEDEGEEGEVRSKTLKLGDYHVIPRESVKDEEPTEEYYNPGYMGNDPGDLTHWYHRAVVIIYLQRDEEAVKTELRGERR
ncbi:2OG-Fe(II) oxygenase [Coprinopsis cinerea okayama7|uniref:2OG-Fe(II) oxygenase n=1 Tax=Coprinopsis cinerea (strain Okayama-7 / 130 / ATCC MYA-4618 / FGSC 9003) TaxID=240176 RepID=A8P9F0_COPC7|nr:2OG-Fe(II) oxygenase [Coprinopsis cinerea okayama7\|eukprot:XP_001839758.1 2OG-Fe(II) oxygenase [Coprinopsis cinerea okayama7\